MKHILLVIFHLVLFVGLNAQEDLCVEKKYTDNQGCVYKTDVTAHICGSDDYIYYIQPTGKTGSNFIQVSFSKLTLGNSFSSYIYLLGYDPATETITDECYLYNSSSDEDKYKNYYFNSPAAIILLSYPDVDVINDFTACYSLFNNYISETNNYTSTKGSFDDGSGTANYGDNFVKRYVVEPDSSDFVELTFTKFDLASDDYIKVFNGSSDNAPLLGSYSSDNIPSCKFVSSINDQSLTGKSLCIDFYSSVQNNSDGWAVEYQGKESHFYNLGFTYDASGNLEQRTIVLTTRTKSAKTSSGKYPAISFPRKNYTDNIGETSINIYPNPTRGELNVDIAGYDLAQKTGIYLFNLSGKIIKQLSPINSSNNMVNLSDSPNGTYILRIVIGDKTNEWKVVKE
jgi:hypothetical protein